MPVELDTYDRKILYWLDRDTRISASKLGKNIHLAKESVNFRIKRLIRDEIIVYFYTLINASIFGYQYYRVYVRLSKYTLEKERHLIDFLSKHPLCANIRIIQGGYSIVFLITTENTVGLRKFLSDFGEALGDSINKRSINVVTRSHSFNQRILYADKSERIRMDHEQASGQGLDEKDQSILGFISLKGRAKLTEIAEETGLDPKVIRYRIKKLEKSGAIAGYGVMLDFKKLGYDSIQIDFRLKNPLTGVYVVEFFNQTNRLVRSYELLGKYDLSIELYTRNDEELKELIDTFRERFWKEYISYDVSRIFKSYATAWSPFLADKSILSREKRIQGERSI